LADISLKTSHV